MTTSEFDEQVRYAAVDDDEPDAKSEPEPSLPWTTTSAEWPPTRAIADDRLELLLSEVHLVAGADHLSATARAERIVAIAAEMTAATR